jgi:hypothetical protein
MNNSRGAQRKQIQTDRKLERWLWLKSLTALAVVVGMVIIREVYFV